MRDELTSMGFKELLTPADVDSFMAESEGTALIVVNSVCGCAAGMARPGVRLALQGIAAGAGAAADAGGEKSARPDRLATVFAGQDVEAVARMRSYFDNYPPSSPSMALFRDGQLVHFVPRHQIEGRSAEHVASDLQHALEKHCRPAV
jgi:putative YphP/YqiW family bacilliredoxin